MGERFPGVNCEGNSCLRVVGASSREELGKVDTTREGQGRNESGFKLFVANILEVHPGKGLALAESRLTD